MEFLDLEAKQSGTSGEEDDEEFNESDDFIDDTNDTNDDEHVRTKIPRGPAQTPSTGSNLDALLERILDRTTRTSARIASSAGPTSNLADDLALGPRTGDHPLWKIKCRLGIEEEAVFFLARARLQFNKLGEWRTAFVSPGFRGWVFVEGTMNEDLITLLKTVPGIVQTHQGIHKEQLAIADWIPVLRVPKSTNIPEKGDWIRVKSGQYKRDLGLVCEIENWGALVLLVPRFQLRVNNPEQAPLKRKRGSQKPSEQRLFDPNEINQIQNPRNLPHLRPQKKNDTTYKFRGVEYHHGLVTRKYQFRALSRSIPPASISSQDVTLFLTSHHPLVLAQRQRLQWTFFEGDKVIVHTSVPGEGIVERVLSGQVEVELATGEGTKLFSWDVIEKVIKPGDYVEVTGGPGKGKTGWVLGVENSTADIGEVEGAGSVETLSNLYFTPFKRHVNSLKVIDPPLHQVQPTGHIQTPVTRSQVPWVNFEVAIVKLQKSKGVERALHSQAHAWRGNLAIVEDVLFDQETLSGLRVKVRLKHEKYNPSNPWSNHETVDYDSVVERHTGYQLLECQTPKDKVYVPKARPHGHKRPPDGLLTPSWQQGPDDSLTRMNFLSTLDPPTTSTGTPLWNRDDHQTSGPLTPAWDPSSRTPVPFRADTAIQFSSFEEVHNYVWGTSSSSLQTMPATTPTSNPVPDSSVSAALTTNTVPHDLVDRRLVGIELKVLYENHDARKEIAVIPAEKNGGIVIQRELFGHTTTYAPTTITIKHPNPTRDNGPLVVIRGEHCGKRVRRIHHRYGSDKRAILRLAVVEQSGNDLGVLTGEEIELDVSELCIATETKEQKKHLDALLSGTREAARKIRAK